MEVLLIVVLVGAALYLKKQQDEQSQLPTPRESVSNRPSTPVEIRVVVPA